MSRNQQRILVGLLIGHRHLPGHLLKTGVGKESWVYCVQADMWSGITCSLWLWDFSHNEIMHLAGLKTSLPAGYCTLLKVQGCLMNELKGCTKINNEVHVSPITLPSVFCCIVRKRKMMKRRKARKKVFPINYLWDANCSHTHDALQTTEIFRIVHQLTVILNCLMPFAEWEYWLKVKLLSQQPKCRKL